MNSCCGEWTPEAGCSHWGPEPRADESYAATNYVRQRTYIDPYYATPAALPYTEISATPRSQMPVVQNLPTPEALITQLGWARDTTWLGSMARFRNGGLSEVTLGWLIAVTEGREGLAPDDRWRYFCGCCWRTLRGE